MNIVFAKHAHHQKQFAFSVPDNLVPYVTKDMDVVVETKSGLKLARTVTGIFSGDGAEDVAKQNGAYLPIKPVVCVLPKEILGIIRAQIKADFRSALLAALETPMEPALKLPEHQWAKLYIERFDNSSFN